MVVVAYAIAIIFHFNSLSSLFLNKKENMYIISIIKFIKMLINPVIKQFYLINYFYCIYKYIHRMYLYKHCDFTLCNRSMLNINVSPQYQSSHKCQA